MKFLKIYLLGLEELDGMAPLLMSFPCFPCTTRRTFETLPETKVNNIK